MKNSKYLAKVIILLLTASMLFVSCKQQEKIEREVISIKGSDTMVNLAQKWAEVYMKTNPNISLQVTGGGSGTGIAALLNGTVDIVNASRELKPKEHEKAKKLGITPKEYKVALDGIAIIVHPDNPVNELSMEQLSKLFTGKIKNWKELGGNDSRITLYGRENSSGTYEFFKYQVLGKNERGHARDFATSTQVLQGTAALSEAIAKDTKGVGYGGVGYFALRTDVKIIKIKGNYADAVAIAPAEGGKVNYEAMWNGDYPISRYLFCYTNGSTEKKIQDFMEFVLSEEGQNIVKRMKYIPLPK